jgi:DNA-directed RNA polymerase subunit alpha
MTTGDDDVLAAPLSSLGLNIRASNALLMNGISTVGDLLAKTETELWRLPLIGLSNMTEIKAKLSARGLALRPGP